MTIVKYIHHGTEVSVDESLKGKNREHCLCYQCGNFKPGTAANCPIASKLYEICVEFDLVTPVFECPRFAQF